MMEGGFDIEKLRHDAHNRWLEPAEVFYVLQNHEEFGVAAVTPDKPTSGSILLFNKRVHRFFRKDGHAWQKKKQGRTIAEAHEYLKVGNVNALNCYYARGEQNPYFRRRCYWMLDQEFEHIVLVHYREVFEGRCIYKPDRLPGTNITEEDHSVGFNGENILCSTDTENISGISFGRVGAIPDFVSQSNMGFQDSGGIVNQSFQLYHQTSLAGRHHLQDSLKKCSVRDMLHGIDHKLVDATENGLDILPSPSMTGTRYLHPWTTLNVNTFQNKNFDLGNKSNNYKGDGNILEIADGGELIFENKVDLNIPVAATIFDAIPSDIGSGQYARNADACKDAFDSSDRLENHALVIREISPERAYCLKNTKVFIIGDFLDMYNQDLVAIFDGAKVSVNIVQNGVLCCQAPQHAPGNVKLCVISGNGHFRSNIINFEYLSKPEITSEIDFSGLTAPVSSGELELLVRLAKFLLCGLNSEQLGKHPESRKTSPPDLLEHEQWDEIMKAVLAGKESMSDSMYRVLQELVKDKLWHWLSSKRKDGEERCSFLSKDEQGLIHMISGLGFVWALSPLLDCNVGINFRDRHGWTALHWAARFGREEMVSALLAAGASAGAVTDPTSHDPVGKSPALIASSHGHKGLSGYLSEMALTSHLSSLKIEETKESQEYAASEAERTIDTVLEKSAQVLTDPDDHVSLKVSLAAVKNAAQAAARILSAFRVHSFKMRQGKADVTFDKYGFIYDLSSVQRYQKGSHLTGDQKYHEAALHIQKTFRGRKGRRNFLTLRKNVVKIQAHVRGHQVRKKYKELLRCVNIIEKIILRWRRGRAGLRGYHLESNEMDEAEGDILKVFRKQKVDEALDKDFKRVLSMVGSTEARKQYRRMVSKHFSTKGEQCAGRSTSSSVQISGSDYNPVENLHFPPPSPLYFEQYTPWSEELLAYDNYDSVIGELWPI